MIKRNFIITVLLFSFLFSVNAQDKKQEVVRREVTLYNPYKPFLPEAKKRSFLPEINDTIKVKPTFRYDVNATPFMPVYTISPIKPASLLPDPLPKLYKSYVRIGLGNYLTPLAELSITSGRSKSGTIGFYGRHYSSNGKIVLDNDRKVFAGFMDNEASLFGKKFFRRSVFEASVDLNQKTRYAYGYDPAITDYSPSKKDIRLGYSNLGAKVGLSSATLDSMDFSYHFDLHFNHFYATDISSNVKLFQNNFGFDGIMAKSFKGFYVGSGLDYDLFKIPDHIMPDSKYIASISPFIKKSTDQWNFKLGFQALLDKNVISSSAVVHFYPDITFGFSVVPSYVAFFAGLAGKLERNDPWKIISENPYVFNDLTWYLIPNTDHQLIINTGIKGNTGIGGNYVVSASYSIVKNMLFYTNVVFADVMIPPKGNGNFFIPLTDDVDVFNLHGEMSGPIKDKLSYIGEINYYKYTLTNFNYAWNKPDWDMKLSLRYNLRDKIIAGMEVVTEGKRRLIVNGQNLNLTTPDAILNPPRVIGMPYHLNLTLSAEYRYSKILSIWARLNNISNNRYYEWAFYPSQRFLMMVGFTYSL
jgi:hypothetical protein